jgi:hypothetical protein
VPSSRIPTICVDRSAIASLTLFNPNEWVGPSRAVVQSCSTERSVISYGVARLTNVCRSADKHCSSHVATLREQWKQAPWDISQGVYFAQVPEVHLLIEAFFSGMKSLLDLLVQLLKTEGIVGAELDGFHRAGDIYGGKVLNALDRNSKAERKAEAKICAALINEHKASWIDEVIRTRDLLVHPSRGAHQLMFEIRLACIDDNLVCSMIVPPRVGEVPINEYAEQQVRNADRFAEVFLAALVAAQSAA